MPDFSLITGPDIIAPWRDPVTGSVHWRDFATDTMLLAGGGRTLFTGRLWSTSFKLNHKIPKLVRWTLLPFTLSAEKPGLIHAVFDLAFFKGGEPFFQWLKEQEDLEENWFSRTQDIQGRQEFRDLVAAHPEWFPDGQDVTIIVEYPPMWLRDP